MNFTELLDKVQTPPVPSVVVAVFFVLFILYIYISKVLNSKKKTEQKPQTSVSSSPKASAAQVSGPAASSGDLELVGVDEKTAAVVMAIVSDKSGIPLNRLQFKSITLMEDK